MSKEGQEPKFDIKMINEKDRLATFKGWPFKKGSCTKEKVIPWSVSSSNHNHLYLFFLLITRWLKLASTESTTIPAMTLSNALSASPPLTAGSSVMSHSRNTSTTRASVSSHRANKCRMSLRYESGSTFSAKETIILM